MLQKYRREIVGGLNWFYENRTSKDVVEGKGFTIINAGENIRDTLIGTVSSILVNNGLFSPGTIILSMAKTIDENLKISIRMAGRKVRKNLKVILEDIAKRVGETAGGHDFAAGALIPGEKEEEFLESAKTVLSKEAMEEVVE